MLNLTEVFSEKINIWLEKYEIFEENAESLIELFQEKMNISDEIAKVITVANLLKNAVDLDSINKLLDELPPRYFVVDNCEDSDEEDIENENKIMIVESNSLNKEKIVFIANRQKVFSKQDIVDSGICLDTSLSTSELMSLITAISLQ